MATNKNEMERKYFPFTLTKVDEKKGTFSGYASIFGVEDAYGDMVDAGAFKKTISEKKRHKLFWSHDAYMPGIGYTEPTEDNVGLRMEDAQLYLDIEMAKAAYINLQNGTLDGLSIGYKTIQEKIDPATNIRHLVEIRLYEISLCNFQACPGAVVLAVKARCADCQRHKDALLEEPGKPTPAAEPQTISEPEILHSLNGLKFNRER